MSSKKLRGFTRILGLCLCVYLIALTYMYFAQESFLFHPKKTAAHEAYKSDLPMEEIWMDVNGDRIHSVYFPRKDTEYFILYFHGNAGLISNVWGKVGAELSEKLNAAVWVMDFPGFGLSTGQIRSEEQLMDVAQSFFKAIPQRGNFRNIILFGRSMGTGIASELAKRVGFGPSPEQVSRVILEAPFSSLRKLVGERVPWVPSFLLRYRFESESALNQFNGPILIFHGDQDVVIPVSHGRQLAWGEGGGPADIRSFHELVEIPGHGHDDLRFTEAYWQRLKAIMP